MAPVTAPVILLIGPSGTGKSSFIKSLLSNSEDIDIKPGIKPCRSNSDFDFDLTEPGGAY